MLSSMPRALLISSLIFVAGCGGRGATATTNMEEVVVEEAVNTDSLLNVMEVRYNQLCAERKVAYSERDHELRRELLERNDAACKALDDSLRWVIDFKRRVSNNR